MEMNQMNHSALDALVSELTMDFVEFLKSELGTCEVPFSYYRTLEDAIRATLSDYEDRSGTESESSNRRAFSPLETRSLLTESICS